MSTPQRNYILVSDVTCNNGKTYRTYYESSMRMHGLSVNVTGMSIDSAKRFTRTEAGAALRGMGRKWKIVSASKCVAL